MSGCTLRASTESKYGGKQEDKQDSRNSPETIDCILFVCLQNMHVENVKLEEIAPKIL